MHPAAAQDDIEGLGRLFIDAEQREKLEAVRRGTYNAERERESRISNVRINGIMMRSGGEGVVWVNGQNTLDGPPIDGVRINPDNADGDTYAVKVMIDGRLVNIKPGQNWSEGTGTVKDNY
jgi:hypothetical protein